MGNGSPYRTRGSSGGDSVGISLGSIVQFIHDVRWLRARLLERSLTKGQWYSNASWSIDKHGPFVQVRTNRDWDKPQMIRRFKTRGAAQIYLERRTYGPDWRKHYSGEYSVAPYNVTSHAE